jgi:GDPmannose 4,6-dehydratase
LQNTQKRALITGVMGQDGGHLAELLHSKGYQVYGLIRGQNESQNPKLTAFKSEYPYVKLISGDLTDFRSLVQAVQTAQPDEAYNLAAISHVGYSFTNPEATAEITGKGVLRMLEAIRVTGGEKTVRFYQASTSEMFGGMDYNRPEGGYTEESPLHPRSPYGVAKVYGHWITKNYRESYGMHASSGILFNHEGPRRGLEFVTRKISNAVARIKLGKQQTITLGDLNPKRDWGYAGDYVRGMWLMLQQDEPGDYLLATGETHSIGEFLDLSFKQIGIEDWNPYVTQDESLIRPAEVNLLLGNPARAERVLGWKREVDFEGLVEMMVKHDLELESASTI